MKSKMLESIKTHLLEILEVGPKDYIVDKVDDLKSQIRSKKKMVERMLFWGWNMRNSHDYDAQTCYTMIHLKLSRVLDSMIKYNHLMWNRNQDTRGMRELRETVELFRRQCKDEYDMKAFEETEAKFGKLRTWSEPIPGVTYASRYRSEWPNNKVAREFYKKRSTHWRELDKQHKKRMWTLLEKNIDQWWD